MTKLKKTTTTTESKDTCNAIRLHCTLQRHNWNVIVGLTYIVVTALLLQTTGLGSAALPNLKKKKKKTMCSYFNWTRCRDLDTMPVYAYPRNQQNTSEEPDEWWDSFTYWNAVRTNSDVSGLFHLNVTKDPNEACVLISDVNSMCQGNNCRGQERSMSYCLKTVPEQDRDSCQGNSWIDLNKKNDVLRRLAERKEIWDDGRNHVLIDWSDDRHLRLGKAMLLNGGTPLSKKQPQDIAFALPPLKRGVAIPEAPPGSKYLLTFKGTRYGPGPSGVREHIRNLHDPENGIIMCFICRFNQKNATDIEKCASDELVYEQYDYDELMGNSTFSVVPRGQGLGSYRLTEAMSFGAIPVIVSDDLELPFPHLVNWTDISVRFNEDEVARIPDVLRNIPWNEVVAMRKKLLQVYDQYFSSDLRLFGAAVQELRYTLAALEPTCRKQA